MRFHLDILKPARKGTTNDGNTACSFLKEESFHQATSINKELRDKSYLTVTANGYDPNPEKINIYLTNTAKLYLLTSITSILPQYSVSSFFMQKNWC